MLCPGHPVDAQAFGAPLGCFVQIFFDLVEQYHCIGFANSCISNEDRIVLAAAGKYLDGMPDFMVPADYGIKFPPRCEFGEVNAIFFECFVGVFRVLGCDMLSTPDLIDSLKEIVFFGACIF